MPGEAPGASESLGPGKVLGWRLGNQLVGVLHSKIV
jgi:hypothetical protein